MKRRFGDVVGVDRELREQRLVELSASHRTRQRVGALAFLGEIERLVEDLPESGGVVLGKGEQALGLDELSFERGLLFLEEGFWKGAIEEGVEQPCLAFLDPGDALALGADLAGVVGVQAGDRFREGVAYVVQVGDPAFLCLDASLVELDPCVGREYAVLHRVGTEVWESAAGASDSPDAGEVGIRATVSLRADVCQPGAAAGADEAAL